MFFDGFVWWFYFTLCRGVRVLIVLFGGFILDVRYAGGTCFLIVLFGGFILDVRYAGGTCFLIVLFGGFILDVRYAGGTYALNSLLYRLPHSETDDNLRIYPRFRFYHYGIVQRFVITGLSTCNQ